MKTNELLIITLAVVILIAAYITIDPSITGFTIIEPVFTQNDNIIVNETIQLKQHSISTNTTQEIYYSINFAFTDKDKLSDLIALDDKSIELEKELLKIKFTNNLENGDKINLYLKNTNPNILNICDFNGSCDTIYETLSYSGIEGHYQTTLSLPEPTNELSIYSVDNKTNINYINASHTETTENTTYYYIPSEIESEIIEQQEWDIFTSSYELNNQTLKFFYRTNDTYIEFTPPKNFSEINSSLQFKLFLGSNNISTPIIHNLSINYIETPCQENYTCNNWTECSNETQTRTCIDQNECGTTEFKPAETRNCTIEESEEENSPQTSSSSPSVTRYSSSPSITTSIKTETKTKTISQQIPLKTTEPTNENIQIQPEIKQINMPKIIGNTIAISYLAFLCLLLYRKRHKL